MAGNIPDVYRQLEGFNTIYSPTEARLAIAISEVMKLLKAGEGAATIIGGDATAANQQTQIDRLVDILARLPPAIGQQAIADSLSIVFPAGYSFPIQTNPTPVVPLDIPTLTLVAPGTVYSVALTRATYIQFSARNNRENLKWHWLPGKVETNDYFTWVRGTRENSPFTSEEWTGNLYFLSDNEANIEVEIRALGVAP